MAIKLNIVNKLLIRLYMRGSISIYKLDHIRKAMNSQNSFKPENSARQKLQGKVLVIDDYQTELKSIEFWKLILQILKTRGLFRFLTNYFFINVDKTYDNFYLLTRIELVVFLLKNRSKYKTIIYYNR